MSIRSRVQAGAKLLTSVYGDAWKKKVKVEDLDMRSPNSCILGQTDSGYFDHRMALGLSIDRTRDLGFEVVLNGYGDLDEQYERLTDEWILFLKGG